ncbi:MAG: glycosyltransferase [Clostridia bacterium]|nr:glycosyltransferase [Clostridia bacterium]
MKKILILYAAYGGGHLSAAKSLKEYIDNNFENVETNLVDCIKYINKSLDKITTEAYKQMAKKAPWAWKRVYYHSEKGALSKISSATNKLIARKLFHLFEEYNPDLVISTHPFSTQMTSYLKKKGKVNCKLATILTDFAPHDQWLVGHKYGDYFFVSHDGMKKALIKNFNVNESKVFTTGIPLSSKFSFNFDKYEIYKLFELSPEKKTILFFGGGEFGLGKNKTVEVLKCLTNYLDNYQIVAISGRNPKMNAAFKEIASTVSNSSSLKIYEFIDNVPELMSISSLVVTKPGGLTITESLASALPILIINPIPGQEEENAEFLEQAGVAVWLKKDDFPNEVINKLLNSEDILSSMKDKTYNLAHINSTKNICEIILKN